MKIYIVFGIEMYSSDRFVEQVVTREDLAEAVVKHGNPIYGLWFDEFETGDEYVEKYLLHKDPK